LKKPGDEIRPTNGVRKSRRSITTTFGEESMIGRKRYIVYAALFTLISINYIDRVALSVAAGPISAELGLTPISLGYLLSSFLWPYVLLLLPMGIAADRYGARMVAGLGMGAWSLATIFTGLATGASAILATRIAMGAAESSSYPAGIRIIRDWAPRPERGLATSIMNSGSYAGPAIGAALVGWLISIFGWRTSFLVVGAVGFVWLIAWFAWYGKPEDSKFVGDAERNKILGEREADKSGSSIHVEGGGTLGLLRSPTMLGLSLTQGCAVYTQYFFLTWLPSYLENVKHLTVLKSGLFTAAPYAIAVVCCITFGSISDRWLKAYGVASGRRRYVVVIAMVSAAVVLFAPFVDNIWLILGLVTLSLIGLSTAISMNITLTGDLLQSPKDAAKAMSLLTIGGNIFGTLAPIVTGYIISMSGGYDGAFLLAGCLLILGAVICLTLTRRPIEGDAMVASIRAAGNQPSVAS
jgi:MFS family permease